MESFALSFPILPGKLDVAKAFGAEVAGPRAAEMAESRRSVGATRETVWVQQTPVGDVGIVLIEGEDVAAANRGFAQSQAPFDVWFKQTVEGFSGVDFGQPIPAWPELAYDCRP
jgi:hypothetical protein